MKIEIIFQSASTPKKCEDVVTVYTKGGLLCIQYANGLIVKYPLCNIFSVSHYHGTHLGTDESREK